MRAGLLVLAVFACGPKVSTTPRAFDDDLEMGKPSVVPAVAEPTSEPRTVAPPGKGLRSGTIARDRLVAVLDAGPGTFLRQLEIAPRLSGDQFVGWRLVQLLDHTGPLNDVDLAPGDVLLAINGKPLARPEQLQAVWDSLRTANEVTAQMWRGDQKLELRFTIDPPVP
jgi:type II secretory pathway component PulC